MKKIVAVFLTVMILAGMNTSLSYAWQETEIVENIETPENEDVIASTETPENEDVIASTETPENEEVIESTETPENVEFIESTEMPENEEVIESTETLENVEVIENTETLENEKVIESSETLENAEIIENEETTGETFDDGISLFAGFVGDKAKTSMFFLTKYDADTGDLLSGAEFKLLQWDKDLNEYTDNLGNGAYLIYLEDEMMYISREIWYTDQNCGKFKLVETKAPEGYIGNYEEEFLLPAEEIICVNVPNKRDRPSCGSITIQKKIREQDIIWEHGNPVFHFCVEGNDSKGNYRKYEDYLEFRQGNYSVDGAGYATLTLTLSDIPYGSYCVSEKNPMRYISEGVSPVKGNVTIAGSVGNVILDEGNKEAGILFQNKKVRYDKFSHCDVVKNRLPIKWN